MGRSLGEMNSGADNAKQRGLDELGILKPAVERFERTSDKPESKGPSKEQVLQRFIDETPTSGGGASRGFAKDVGPKRKSTIPTARMGTVPEGGQRARTKDVSVPFHEMHTTYSNLINTARNFRPTTKNPLSPEHHDALDTATTHLMNSIVSYHRATSEGGLGTPTMHNPTAHSHLYDAVKHLAAAHETLVQSGVHTSMASRKLNAPLPKDEHVADLAAKASTLEGQGVGGVQGAKKPYKEGKLGKGGTMTVNENVLVVHHPDHPGTLEIPQGDLHKLATTFGRHHPAVEKMHAMMGTQRGAEARITQQDRFEGVETAKKAGIAKDAPVNPKRPGTGRRIDTGFKSDANRLGQTPRWGESRGTGTIKGFSEQPSARREGVRKGIEQQTPNPQAQEATKAVRKIPSGKPGPGKIVQRRLKNNGK